MSINLTEQLSFLPLSVVVCPKIQGGRLTIRRNDRLVPEASDRDIASLHSWMRDCLEQRRLARLEELDRKISAAFSPQKEPLSGRSLMLDLFPILTRLGEEKEKRLFQGRTVEDYVNAEALPGAMLFREWVVEKLPRSYRQRLGLMAEVEGSSYDILGLISLLDVSNSLMTEAVEDEDGYRKKLNQQVVSILGLAFLSAVAELSKSQEGEALLSKFQIAAGRALKDQKKIGLLLNFGVNGKVVHMCITQEGDDPREKALLENREFDRVEQLTVRRFGSAPKMFVIYDQRNKTSFSRIWKMFRGRRLPAPDMQGVRFILGDRRYLDLFIRTLREKMPKWEIKEEQKATPSPESRLRSNVQYCALLKDGRGGGEIEVQVDWLTDSDKLMGSCIEKLYEADTNPVAYKMRQGLNAIFPALFPKEIYGIDWEDERVKRECMNYANQIADVPSGSHPRGANTKVQG